MYKALKTLGFGTKTIKIGSKLSEEEVKKIGERGIKILLKNKSIEKAGNGGSVEVKAAEYAEEKKEYGDEKKENGGEKKEYGGTFGLRKK